MKNVNFQNKVEKEVEEIVEFLSNYYGEPTSIYKSPSSSVQVLNDKSTWDEAINYTLVFKNKDITIDLTYKLPLEGAENE